MEGLNQEPPTFQQMLHSVMAAAFGVQNGRNHARGFSHGKPVRFITLSPFFTLASVLLLAGTVKLVLSLSDLWPLRRRGRLSLAADSGRRGSHHQQDQDECRMGVDHTVAVFLGFVRPAHDSPCFLQVSEQRHRKTPSN